MMDFGFYHPDLGYWVAVGVRDEDHLDELIDGYPKGTVSVRPSPGDDYVVIDGEWVHVPVQPPTPEEVRASMPSITRRQLRLTLVRHGITLPSVSDAIDDMPEGLERDEMRIEWDDGTTYERLNPRLNAIADVLGLTQEQVDAMWDAAVAA